MKNMDKNYKITDSKLVEIIKNGGVGVLPTDTLYGIVGNALNKKSVEKIYKLKKRNSRKKVIILIGSLSDLKLFSVSLNNEFKKIISDFWPGKVTIILPVRTKKFAYLLKKTKTLAFRLPKKTKLVNLLKKTGPLIAPSANREGEKPAKTIIEAKKYFGNEVDFYVDDGKQESLSSTIIRLRNHHLMIRRKGAVKIK
jgi:L-threonylcarbamoyladenylate synthase